MRKCRPLRRGKDCSAEFEKKRKRQGYRLIAGIDEAGVGPWAGPVVAAAVILRDFYFRARIYDSKCLTARSRLKALAELIDKAYVGLGIVDVKTIDSVNIYNATRLAMERALRSLRPAPDFVLVDGKIKLGIKKPAENIIGGDRKSISIAAASITAKVVRDKIMEGYDRLYPEYGFARHKGYGTKEHALVLKTKGPCPIHRKSFRPLKEVLPSGYQGRH